MTTVLTVVGIGIVILLGFGIMGMQIALYVQRSEAQELQARRKPKELGAPTFEGPEETTAPKDSSGPYGLMCWYVLDDGDYELTFRVDGEEEVWRGKHGWMEWPSAKSPTYEQRQRLDEIRQQIEWGMHKDRESEYSILELRAFTKTIASWRKVDDEGHLQFTLKDGTRWYGTGDWWYEEDTQKDAPSDIQRILTAAQSKLLWLS